MTTYIEYTEGKVYDVAHLKPFNLELAKCWHPLALFNGYEISHLFEAYDGKYIISTKEEGALIFSTLRLDSDAETNGYIFLAPLAIKDGKPLHVGDVVEWHGAMGDIAPWRKEAITVTNIHVIFDEFRYRWRWPQGDEK